MIDGAEDCRAISLGPGSTLEADVSSDGDLIGGLGGFGFGLIEGAPAELDSALPDAPLIESADSPGARCGLVGVAGAVTTFGGTAGGGRRFVTGADVASDGISSFAGALEEIGSSERAACSSVGGAAGSDGRLSTGDDWAEFELD